MTIHFPASKEAAEICVLQNVIKGEIGKLKIGYKQMVKGNGAYRDKATTW